MTALVIVIAVVSACCSAIGAHLQHQGVRDETEVSRPGLRVAGRLLHNRQWLLGFATLFTCAVLQILALALAPVTMWRRSLAGLVCAALAAIGGVVQLTRHHPQVTPDSTERGPARGRALD
jgi:hypothetical protein